MFTPLGEQAFDSVKLPEALRHMPDRKAGGLGRHLLYGVGWVVRRRLTQDQRMPQFCC
jgi:hypothetical protein